ncbi:Ger(x)C family spore germination C-terminal domain-containing protein [uncultured Flavonifractor sp.]|uniref:Ger(x)C family spore germination protein n=1 Tax=uncultured Flavonifractor sp. TaxID=1193534 RepID=UPI0026321958|nr:Ger(x)C family spore germination C-terminal domain-containing protein [uncultured Flavonifractor sp.]
MRGPALFLPAALLLLLLSGCGSLSLTGLLPYAREIEDMELVRTLGVDGDGTGVAVTASGGAREGEETSLTTGRAETVSAAVLAMQSQGSSYLYFGHVGQLLLGEELARRGVEEPLDYVLRDVEMRLETALYLVRDGTAGQAMGAAAEDGSAADRLEALAEGVGLTADTMTRSVKEVLADLEDRGASFAPALLPDGTLTAAGYGILKDGALAGWTGEEAALGVNLILSRVDADVVEVTPPGQPSAALRVVGARSLVRPVFEGGTLTGLRVECRVEANLAEGPPGQEAAWRQALCDALARVEQTRIQAALDLARTLNADYLGLCRSAALLTPWHKAALLDGTQLEELTLTAQVEAVLQRSYHADG